ncbi:S49 family peptidase [Halorientalis salina]|uniref:S49 family peptidase n=1 Tax=Halorientalis salina TaxID=2932266 RepID=UPI0010ABD5CE|nr:S49 family peptidase [Halorientalis salina]
MSRENETTGPAAWQYAVVAVVAVLIGAVMAPYAAGVTRGLGQSSPDAVAVVTIEGPITSGSVDRVRDDLREARQNESIQAVVLEVNSPGGSVPASESLYLAVNRTAAEMPVVASVEGVGASGGYFGMLPADRIYVTPGSLIGSVGVVATAPTGAQPPGAITSGPDKGSGFTREEALAQAETLRSEFVGTVMEERGSELDLTREQVSYAKVYLGSRAVENGIADRIGDQDTAIAHAASRADLDDYAVVEKEPPQQQGISLLGQVQTGDGNTTVVVEEDTFGYRGVETYQYLALYGSVEDREVITDE